ncbi:MAG: EscU/YscU/HrcU family type III secretion system export apparatus switch protein [Burkholderiales bacterium]|jgi:flagellar biosynthetic protein FlhB|nr:EscU/YscU/HrcU family type III secretion system export apparatus switch protein [Burkholderiales bacterium]
MESSSQDRHLPATPRKLLQARRDGQAARSRDLGHLAVLGMGAVGVLMLAPWMTRHLRQGLADQLAFDAATLADPSLMLQRLASMVLTGLMIAGAFAAIVGAAVVIGTVASGGWVASLKPITPQISRINPLSGLSNLFSKQQLANVGKLIVMAIAIGWLGWSFVASHIGEVATLMLQPSAMAIARIGDWLVSGVSLMLMVVLLVAILDVPLQRYFHASKLKMSHQEVKQEHKESDGNPHLKGKLRSAAREIAQRASITAVPAADFVLMNPTHYAVAIRYDDKTMMAPQVISKGADLLAMRIRDIAKSHAIPVIQSPMLARALYAHAELDQPIPTQLYTAVAQVLAYVYRLKAAIAGRGSNPGEPPEPHVPVELDPHHGRTPAEGAAG